MDSKCSIVFPFKMKRSLLLLYIGVLVCFVTVSGQRANSDRQVIHKPSLVAIINKPAEMGVILDYSSRLIVVLNRNRSSIIVVDLSEHVRYYLGNETDTLIHIWSNFPAYFNNLYSLKSLLDTGKDKGDKSSVGTLQEPVRGVLVAVFDSLGGNSPMPVELSLLTRFIEQLRGNLSLVYWGSGSFRIAIGVDRFTEMNLALAQLLGYSQEKLSPENVHLTATQIFKTSSGVEVLLNVLYIIGARFDLYEEFSRLFAYPEKVQSLLMNATSGSHDGLDGLITILVDYVGVFSGRNGIDQLINSILRYNSRPSLTLSSLVKRALALLAKQKRLFQNDREFSIYVTILNGIVAKNYTYDSLSLSNIITRITMETKHSSNPLFTLVKLLSSFYPASTIPHFFGTIIKQFNQTLDRGSTPENSNSQVYYKPSLIAIINNSTQMGLILDYSSRLIVVLNGNRSTIIVIDISEHVRYFLGNETDTLNNIWSNFEACFGKLRSLQLLLETGKENGDKSSLDTLQEPVRGVLIQVFNSLGGSLPMPEELSLHTKLIEDLRGPLTVVYKESGCFSIASGVDAFTKVNLAIAGTLSYREE